MQTTYPLGAYGMMARNHWKKFRPRMYRALEAAGKLEEALHEAQERTLDELEGLTHGLEQDLEFNPQQAQDQAWEMVRERYILLPPEDEE